MRWFIPVHSKLLTCALFYSYILEVVEIDVDFDISQTHW